MCRAAPATPPHVARVQVSSSHPYRISMRKQEGGGLCDDVPELLDPSRLGTSRAVTWLPTCEQ